MAFPMTHLCIAQKIAEINPSAVNNLPQFLLGSLAPDSVHFRSDFKSEYKKITHLCVGDEKWGAITNNDEWAGHVIDFARTNRQSENIDFIYGHCAHILSDIRNNIRFWTPFKMRFSRDGELNYERIYESDALKIFHAESINMDTRIFQTTELKDKIWDCLKNSVGIDLFDIVCAEEVDKIRENVLYYQYDNKEQADVSENKYVIYDDMLNYIDETSKYISEKLFER